MVQPKQLIGGLALAAWGLFSAWALGRYAEAYPLFTTWPSHLETSALDCLQGSHAHLLENLRAMAHALATFAAMVGVVIVLGVSIERPLALSLAGAERWLMRIGLGAAALHTIMFASGVAGLWYPKVILGAAIGTLLAGVWLWGKAGRPLPRLAEAGAYLYRRPWTLIALGLIVLAAIEGLAPETGGDAGLYHVGVPSTWLADHQITFLRDRYVANLPLPQSMFYAFLIAIGPADAAGLFQPAMLLVAALALSRTVERYVDRPRFPLEIWALLATPALNGYLAISGNDQLTIAFFALGLLFGLRAVESPSPDVRGFAIALFFVGFGMSAKYTAIPHGLLLVAFLSIQWVRRRGPERAVAAGLLLFAAPFSLWAVKAWLYTHNPVYPALAGVFGHEHADPDGIAMAFASNVPRIHGLFEHLTFLYQTTMKAPALMHNAGPHWLILIPVALVVGVRRDRRTSLLAASALACGWLVWSLLYMSARYSAPLFAMTGVAISVVLNAAAADRPRLGPLGLMLLAAGMLWTTAMAWAYRHDVVRPYTYLCGAYDAVGYTFEQDLQMTAFPERPMLAFLDRTLDRRHDRVLLVGEDRTGDLRIPHIAGTRYDRPIFEAYLAGAATAAEVRENLRRDGVTHLAVNVGLGSLFVKSGYPILAVAPEERALWSEVCTRWIDVIERRRHGEEDWLVGRLRDAPASEPVPDLMGLIRARATPGEGGGRGR